MMIKAFFTFIILSSSLLALAQDVSEKEKEFINFDSIKKVIKSDLLEKEVEQIKKNTQKKKTKKTKEEWNRFRYPTNKDFWTFMSEYWLVKNATVLRWDFEKPDYGISEAFEKFLEKMGHYEVRFKVLLINSSNVAHFALPMNDQEYLFILSVPFIRTLDLSKLQISLLLYEDFIRVNKGFFKKRVTTKKLNEVLNLGTPKVKKVDVSFIKEVVKKYDQIIFDKGFTFQQQYEVTMSLSRYLKNDMKLWKNYIQMLKKIDELTKYNLMYKYYLKIYPSAELQLNWLKPKIPKRY